MLLLVLMEVFVPFSDDGLPFRVLMTGLRVLEAVTGYALDHTANLLVFILLLFELFDIIRFDLFEFLSDPSIVGHAFSKCFYNIQFDLFPFPFDLILSYESLLILLPR